MASWGRFGLAFVVFILLFVMGLMFAPTAASAGVIVSSTHGSMVTWAFMIAGVFVLLGGGLL